MSIEDNIRGVIAKHKSAIESDELLLSRPAPDRQYHRAEARIKVREIMVQDLEAVLAGSEVIA